jgi:hypothetical protein
MLVHLEHSLFRLCIRALYAWLHIEEVEQHKHAPVLIDWVYLPLGAVSLMSCHVICWIESAPGVDDDTTTESSQSAGAKI